MKSNKINVNIRELCDVAVRYMANGNGVRNFRFATAKKHIKRI